MNNQAAAQLMAMSQIKTQNEDAAAMFANKPPPPSSTFFTSPTDQSLLAQFNRKPQYQHLQQQLLHQQQQPPIRFNTIPNTTFGGVTFPSRLPQVMKINLPNPEQTLKKNMFPEPSPAACGSRKIIELAAAKMLAAVGNKSVASVDDFSRKSTPPPSVNLNNLKKESDHEETNGLGGTKRSAPGPVRLQIVNPEALGVVNENNGHKRRNIGQEPTTPWDGELEALGRYVLHYLLPFIEIIKFIFTHAFMFICMFVHIICIFTLISTNIYSTQFILSNNSEVKSKEQHNMGPTSSSVSTIFHGEEEQTADHPLYQSASCIRSALHMGVIGGSLQEVKHLMNTLKAEVTGGMMNNGAQLKVLNAIDSNGFGPLHSAVSLNPSNMAVVMTHLLLSYGADAASLDKYGNSPLHWAARAGNDEIAQILVLKNCSPGK
jgi:hypothetical protein